MSKDGLSMATGRHWPEMTRHKVLDAEVLSGIARRLVILGRSKERSDAAQTPVAMP